MLLSPGPGRPEDAGIICACVPAFAERGTPVLGVCLGHQAIGHVFGAIDRSGADADARQDVADRARTVPAFSRPAFAAHGTRYHSLVIDPASDARSASR